MSFDLTDAYLAIIELNEKIEFIADVLIKKGIMPKPKEEVKKDEKIA